MYRLYVVHTKSPDEINNICSTNSRSTVRNFKMTRLLLGNSIRINWNHVIPLLLCSGWQWIYSSLNLPSVSIYIYIYIHDVVSPWLKFAHELLTLHNKHSRFTHGSRHYDCAVPTSPEVGYTCIYIYIVGIVWPHDVTLPRNESTPENVFKQTQTWLWSGALRTQYRRPRARFICNSKEFLFVSICGSTNLFAALRATIVSPEGTDKRTRVAWM